MKRVTKAQHVMDSSALLAASEFDPLSRSEAHQYIAAARTQIQLLEASATHHEIIASPLTQMSFSQRDWIPENRGILIEQISQYVEEFRNALIDFHSSHDLDVDIDQIVERLTSLRVTVVDPARTSLDGEGGYDIPSHILLVSTFSDPENLKHIIFHECAHAVSGIGYLRMRDEETAGRGAHTEGAFFGWDRQGLTWTKAGEPLQYKSLHWANEGATEFLARKTLGLSSKFVGPRESEVTALKRFFTDVAPRDFYNLYFVDGNQSDARVIAFAKTIENSIEQSFDAHILERLDAAYEGELRNSSYYPERLVATCDKYLPEKKSIVMRIRDYLLG